MLIVPLGRMGKVDSGMVPSSDFPLLYQEVQLLLKSLNIGFALWNGELGTKL